MMVLCLMVLCLPLAFCQDICFNILPKLEMINGEWVTLKGCTDRYDKSQHPSGSEWKTAYCLRCTCDPTGMRCCPKYDGIADFPGCIADADQATCEYTFYMPGDPSTPCGPSIH